MKLLGLTTIHPPSASSLEFLGVLRFSDEAFLGVAASNRFNCKSEARTVHPAVTTACTLLVRMNNVPLCRWLEHAALEHVLCNTYCKCVSLLARGGWSFDPLVDVGRLHSGRPLARSVLWREVHSYIHTYIRALIRSC